MRRVILVTIATVALAVPCAAEQRTMVLPEIIIGGAPSSGAPESCVEGENSRAYNCLNQKLRRQVDRVNPSMNVPPLDARSTDIRVGVVNMPAVQQQYGRNFGVSVIPYRPAPPVFTSPIVPRR